MTRVATADDLARVVRANRFFYADEDGLHQGLGAAWTEAGYTVRHEVKIDGGRIDFVVDRVGVEVKIAGTGDRVFQQCAAYAADRRLDALLVVTTRFRHTFLPSIVGGKPLTTVLIGGFF
ncbi:hypothetical protein BH10ACT3_BH10ACT3_17170 [soil metagenome]